MSRITDYIDRWRIATPVIQPEIEGYIPLPFKGAVSDPRDIEEITLESLIPRLEKLESMVEEMMK